MSDENRLQYMVPKNGRRMVRELPVEERPVKRLAEYGPQSLSTAELLAVVLQTGDALDLAQDVLTAVGGLHRLARCNWRELTRLKGVGQGQAARLLAAMELGRRLVGCWPERVQRVVSPGDAAKLLMADMMLLEQEQFWVILLDTRNHVMGTHMVYMGNVNSAIIRTAEVYRAAIQQQAVAILVAHNHPSGEVSPSQEDIEVTKAIVQAGKLLDIECLDHVIIGHNRYISLKASGFWE